MPTEFGPVLSIPVALNCNLLSPTCNPPPGARVRFRCALSGTNNVHACYRLEKIRDQRKSMLVAAAEHTR
eukprot:917631-Rhodomonas_salina.1